ncbi:hypothetical protein M728_005516 (plasmid) [Ensifer sp. WSM1721]
MPKAYAAFEILAARIIGSNAPLLSSALQNSPVSLEW